MDKCYKLHGFPPGYKFRNQNFNNTEIVVAPSSTTVGVNSVAPPNSSNFFSTLNTTQYTQLMEMLNSHLKTAATDSIVATSAVTHTIGICSLTSSPLLLSSNTWIVSSGASRKISFCHQLFHNWRRVSGVTVLLPTTFRVSGVHWRCETL